MIIIGLTGPSGAGKGEFCRAAMEFDCVQCIDTDKISHEVVGKGQPCLDELVYAFGREILQKDGSLDRKKLAAIAFSSDNRHSLLNTITHAYVLKEVSSILEKLGNDGCRAAIIDAPLLFESGADKLCSVTVCICASYNTRLHRVLLRDEIDEKNAKIRLDSQPDEDFYRQRCDHCIINNGDIDTLHAKSKELIASLLGK